MIILHLNKVLLYSTNLLKKNDSKNEKTKKNHFYPINRKCCQSGFIFIQILNSHKNTWLIIFDL